MTPGAPGTDPPLPWRPTSAFLRALALGGGGFALGVGLGSPVLAVLAVPFVLLCVLAAAPRPGLVGRPVRTRAARSAAVGERLDVHLDVPPAVAATGAELAVLRLPQGDRPAGTAVALVVPGVGRRLTCSCEPAVWGRRTVARPDALLLAADGMLRIGPVPGEARGALVVPSVRPAAAGPLPAHPTSVVGRHRSRRIGDGGDLHTVDEFRVGDRLRRIDWRATARRHSGAGEAVIHVRRTTVDAEGQVVLLLDTRSDLDTDVETWSTPRPLVGGAVAPGSSLDLVVSTAVSLAAAHLAGGDRVSTVDLTTPTASVAPGSGRRHLDRLRTALAATSVAAEPGGTQRRGGADRLPRRLLDQVPARAVVVVLSPFLDDRIASLAAALQRHGRATLGVDCLPTGLRPDRSSPWGEAALQLLLAEKDNRLAGLAARGVVVLPAGADLASTTRWLVRARERAAR